MAKPTKHRRSKTPSGPDRTPAEGLIELDIERMSYGSAAVGRFTPPGESRPAVVFVEGAVPGDRVRVQLVQWHGNYWQGKLVEVLKPSSHRAEPPCPVFGKCGGCQWQHLDYETQVQAKKEILLHQLRKTVPGVEEHIQTHPAPSPWGYRNRIQARGDAEGLGFYAKESHEIVHVDYCRVSSPEIQKVWQKFVQTRPLAELSKKGQFKIEWVHTGPGQVLEAINREHAALGFTQVNDAQNQVLIRLVKAFAEKDASGQGVLFDLYGGDGNLSRGLSEKFKKIFCVEAYGTGKNPADIGAEDVGNYTYIKSDVAGFLRDRYWEDWGITKPDCIVADPPRAGMKDVVPHLLAMKARRLVLVSCDPSTLARDLAPLLTEYKADEIHFVDMFPQTYHIESVVCLSLR